MAQATLSQPAGIPASVATKLRGLRMKINTWLLIDGVSRVLAVAAVLLLVWFLLDYWLTFDFYLRLGNLIFSCAVLGYLIYRGLVVPFSARVSDDALVLAVEKHYGQELGESVISAVQFARMTNEIEVQGVSPQLVRATIDQGLQAANRVPFGSLVDTRWLTANVAILAIGAVMLGLYAYGATAYRGTEYANEEVEFAGQMHSVQVLGIAFDREVLLKDTPWPQDVYYQLNVGDEKVILFPRGDDFVLEVRLDEKSKSSPDEIDELLINVIGPTGRFSESLVRVEKAAKEKPTDGVGGGVAGAGGDSTAAEGDTMEFDHFLFEMPNVREDFLFQLDAIGVRGTSAWFEVKLVDRPQVKELKLAYVLPPYAGGKDIELAAGTGPHHILRGSKLKIEGIATKPLTEVQVRFGAYRSTLKIDGQTSFSHVIPASAFAMPNPSGDSDGGNPENTIAKAPEEINGGVVSIDLWDTESILVPGETAPGPLKSKPTTKVSLRVKPDRGPDVLARLEDISGMVTPDATIPFDCFIKDEYAITEVALRHKWKHEENEAEHGQGEAAIESIKSKLGNSTLRFGESLKLAPLKIPTGSGLSFHIAAKDNNNISGPGEGQSTVFLLRVVSQAELQRDIIRRQVELHQDFKRLHEQQIKMLDDTDVLRAETRDSASLSPEQRQSLMDVKKGHRLLETNIGDVAGRMESIVKEMRNNRLEDSESALLEKLQNNVIQPMQELAQGEVDQATRQLDRARSAENKQQQRDEALDKAIAQQQRNEQKMEKILKNMADAEGYQEVVSFLYEVIGDTENVKELTEKERQRLIQEILEGGQGEEDKDK